MLDFINSIPNWLGWTLVCATFVACVLAFHLLIQTVITMIDERLEAEEETE